MKCFFTSVLLVLFLLPNCKRHADLTDSEIVDSATALIAEDSLHVIELVEHPHADIASHWQQLAFVDGGCLTGGEYGGLGGRDPQACVLNTKQWSNFFARDTLDLSRFLMSKLSNDTITTRVHTCPFFSATEGELAVYALQKIYGINWYDFDTFQSYQGREITGPQDNFQAWLQRILANEAQREALITHWIEVGQGFRERQD